MNKVKIIRGRPIYIYKRTNYMYKPDKTIVYKMLYNSDDNITYVYCKKPSILLEVICILICLCCVFVNRQYLHGLSVDIHYNNIATYYNGCLYLNLMSGETNNIIVHYELKDNSETIAEGYLNPGDLIISVPINNICDRYTLVVSYKILFYEKEETSNIIVLNRDIEMEENYDFYYD